MSKEGQRVTQGPLCWKDGNKNVWISRKKCGSMRGTNVVLETSYQSSMLETVSENYAEGHHGPDKPSVFRDGDVQRTE